MYYIIARRHMGYVHYLEKAQRGVDYWTSEKGKACRLDYDAAQRKLAYLRGARLALPHYTILQIEEKVK